jgi:cytochrome c2
VRAVALIAAACTAVLCMTSAAHADEKVGRVERAAFNYQLLCQGCHTPDGSGAQGVPQMRGVLGYFLGSDEGRAYLVRVPGSANAALNDAHLA